MNNIPKEIWIQRVIDIVATKLEVATHTAYEEIKKLEDDQWYHNYEKNIDQYDTGKELYDKIMNMYGRKQ